ncbi:hypothetical protein HW555_012612 [Spodoptera exigua]|uniref:Uncharacterized protein n=1 Tax=Spodoptera exigua TaxID=7107 RepID=A0A835L0K2_SPOEX|nr:hypothetical protein HW555_012612 [Spodoptera exigua]
MTQFQYDQELFSVLILEWIVVDLSIILALCVQYEKFHLALDEAESTCIQLLMSANCSSKYTANFGIYTDHLMISNTAHRNGMFFQLPHYWVHNGLSVKPHLRYDKIDQVVFPILIMAWIIMEAAVILALCVQCEKFYMAVEEAESTCIQLVMRTKCSSKNIYFKFCKFPFHTFLKGA